MANNYTCIIVDDEQDAVELLGDRLGRLYKNINVVSTYQTWEDALAGLRTQKCDILFMDISMPGKTGMQLLKLLPQLDSEIIFVTAHEQYALEAFSFTTSGYVLKPVDDIELSNAVNIALGRIAHKRMAQQAGRQNAVPEKIGIPNNQGTDYVTISDILYLESTNKCTRIVTERAEYISSQNLGKFSFLIEKHKFFQVHRSYIINLNKVLRYESSGLVMLTNKKEIPVARSYRAEIVHLLGH